MFHSQNKIVFSLNGLVHFTNFITLRTIYSSILYTIKKMSSSAVEPFKYLEELLQIKIVIAELLKTFLWQDFILNALINQNFIEFCRMKFNILPKKEKIITCCQKYAKKSVLIFFYMIYFFKTWDKIHQGLPSEFFMF